MSARFMETHSRYIEEISYETTGVRDYTFIYFKSNLITISKYRKFSCLTTELNFKVKLVLLKSTTVYREEKVK